MPDVCRFAAIVLAGGGGSRLGGGKLLLPWRGEPLLVHTVRAVFASGAADRVTLVLGHDADQAEAVVRRAFPDHNALDIVVNTDWERGQSGSLRAGLALAGEHDAALVALGDQPEVRPETYRILVQAHRAALAADPEHGATAPYYAGRRGNPVVFSRRLFGAMAAVTGDRGARDILTGLGDAVLRVPVDDPGVVRDVDTPAAYRELCEGME